MTGQDKNSYVFYGCYFGMIKSFGKNVEWINKKEKEGRCMRKNRTILTCCGIMIICCFLLINSFHNSHSEQLFQEQTVYQTDREEKTANLVDRLMRSGDNHVSGSAKLLQSMETNTKKDRTFIRSMESPVLLEDGLVAISHLAFSFKMKKFYNALHVSAPEEDGDTYIFNCNGFGGVQRQEQRLNNEVTNSQELKNPDKKIFLPAQQVSPGVIGSGTQDELDEKIIYVSLIAFMAILIIVVAVYVMIASEDNKKLMKQKEEANRLLNKAALEAQAANAAKSEFLSNMSHDIRTPINGIMGMTDIALRHFDDKDRVKECLNKISGSSEHLLSLINDVLDMSRIESGKVIIAENSIDLIELIDNCVSVVGEQIRRKNINLKKEYKHMEHHYVIGDQLHMSQIFVNILGNAVKFTQQGGQVDIRVEEKYSDGKTVAFRFEIEDNGIGMREEFLPKLFEPFAQEDRDSRTEYRGTGLGMAITKKYVDLMGGTITVNSIHGKGSVFAIELTLDVDKEEQEREESHQEVISLDGLKVLLVEDNELNMEIALSMLEDEGIEVTTACNGKEALECFQGSEINGYDAVLMDIMMPVMNGLEATKAIRALEREDADKVPIIAMTANAFAEDVMRTKEAGMNEHLAKPMRIDILLKLLQHYKKKKELLMQ